MFYGMKIEINYLDKLHKLFFQKERKKVKAEAKKQKQI